jgi:lysozyme
MTYSKTGREATERFEGLSLVAYLDSVGVPTIGYGHTYGVKLGDTCTQEQADLWLQSDVSSAVDCVNRLVTVVLSQDEFDSLVDFTFNLGCAALAHSTLLRDLNAGNYDLAAAEFEKWDHAGGKVVAGLLRRRITEEQAFKNDGSTSPDAPSAG